jgi:predicted O-methyltransferase YrrM
MRNLSLLKKLWQNRVAVRGILESDGFIFVRDFPPGHFYSPVPNLSEIQRAEKELFNRKNCEIPAVNLNEAVQLEMLKAFSQYYGEMPFRNAATDGFRYYLDNPFFSYGDGIILYSFMRKFRPRRIVEIGSGYSSAEMLDVRDKFKLHPMELIFIEPRPERLNRLLREDDRKTAKIYEEPVQTVDVGIFASLEENDILFVDSSHIGKIGSDLLHLLFNVFPLLKKGVIIHVHDVTWPFEYPENWVYEGRAFNEAYFLRAFLQFNRDFEILYFNSYIKFNHMNLLRQCLPLALSEPSTKETEENSSIWLRRV